jgi:dynein heavy chain, axonemal
MACNFDSRDGRNFKQRRETLFMQTSFSFVVRDDLTTDETSGPEDGCYITGLFMEGARWDDQRHVIGESRPKELFTQFPVVWLQPEQHREPPSRVYNCPVYKTLTRAGTLSTTGHSTNFVMDIELPSDTRESHWINRGVALFCSLAF